MKFLNRRKQKISCFEKFFCKIFRRGLKLKFLRIFKKNLILIRVLKHSLKNLNLDNIEFSPNIIEEKMLENFLPEYSITYLIKRNFKERKNEKLLKSSITKIDKRFLELFKWLYLTVYKIPVRTIQLRLLYLFFCLSISGTHIENLNKESKKIFAQNTLSFKKKFKFKKLKKYKLRKKLNLKKKMLNV